MLLAFSTKESHLALATMQTLESNSVGVLLFTALATIVAYGLYSVLYNVYFHPLARFPGPPLASTTIYWKAYVECVANRSFCHELVKLHAQYGKSIHVRL